MLFYTCVNKLARVRFSTHRKKTTVPQICCTQWDRRSLCSKMNVSRLTSAGKKGCVRLTLLYTVGRTHRQESPGYRPNLPGNPWPATLPQFICKQRTAVLDVFFPQGPKTNLSRHCLTPPIIPERPPPPAPAATDKHREKAPNSSPEQHSGQDTAPQW